MNREHQRSSKGVIEDNNRPPGCEATGQNIQTQSLTLESTAKVQTRNQVNQNAVSDSKDRDYEKGKPTQDNIITTDHSVNGTDSGMNEHSDSGVTTITDASVSGTDSGHNRPSEPRRFLVGNRGLYNAMAPPQPAAGTMTPEVVEVTLEQLRGLLERRQEQAALYRAGASNGNEVTIVMGMVGTGPVPGLSLLCTREQWDQLKSDFPNEHLRLRVTFE
ncbi:hypothetical protein E4U16_008204 [Claviceps sp. LM84 group G4]|nr:hypothetical protein E4U16_008204 [Claviceps sp. LM84 group G4]